MNPKEPKRFVFNWGHGMAVTLVAFGALIIGLAVGTFRQNIDLVEDDYAESEIRYQDRQLRAQRGQELETPLEIAKVGPEIVLRIPGSLVESFDSAKVYLFRPEDQKFDRVYEAAFEADGLMRIPTSDLLPGVWRVVLDLGGPKGYYKVETLYI